MSALNRRKFLTHSGLSLIPALIPFTSVFGNDQHGICTHGNDMPILKFYGDGEMFEPTEYISALQNANTANKIVRDGYGRGGTVEALEKKISEITGKEKSIYMPSGTMANQLAISVLSGERTKVFVQDTSHVYRDEADAAQSVYKKRLMPLARNEAYFTASQLIDAIENLKQEEVFESGIGAVSVENPVRRADGRVVPLGEIQKISSYCRDNKIGIHLDGARIFIASAWTGIPVAEYASYFDTVYISLYKYFGACGGAILSGSASIIDKMAHLVKIHGGNMYGNWTNAAMALHRMEGFETRLQQAISKWNQLFPVLNEVQGIQVEALDQGTNNYLFRLDKKLGGNNVIKSLSREFGIRIPWLDEKNETHLTVNETLLYQSNEYIINSLKKTIQSK